LQKVASSLAELHFHLIYCTLWARGWKGTETPGWRVSRFFFSCTIRRLIVSHEQKPTQQLAVSCLDAYDPKKGMQNISIFEIMLNGSPLACIMLKLQYLQQNAKDAVNLFRQNCSGPGL
jgi:hypothetical protein